MKIRDFQAEQKEWTERNFGVGPADHPLLGIIEELGELSHAVLKAAQGIRGNVTKHEEAAKDAVGDLVIYLADYATKTNVALGDLTAETTFEGFQQHDSFRLDGTPVELLPRIAKTLGKVAEAHMANDWTMISVGLGALLQEIATFCRVKGWSLDDIVTETWAEVSKRDWTKNKETGQAPV